VFFTGLWINGMKSNVFKPLPGVSFISRVHAGSRHALLLRSMRYLKLFVLIVRFNWKLIRTIFP
jgi:hypothetical protein